MFLFFPILLAVKDFKGNLLGKEEEERKYNKNFTQLTSAKTVPIRWYDCM